MTHQIFSCTIELSWVVVSSNDLRCSITNEYELQEMIIAFVRAFGLHRPNQTPCGQPVTIAEAHALIELSRQEHLSQHNLNERLHLEKSTVSRLVGILEQRGWLERRRSQQDGRIFLLELTEAGQKAAAQLAQARQAKFARILAAIPAEAQPQVLSALDILLEAMNEAE